MKKNKELECPECGCRDFFDYLEGLEGREVLISKCNNLYCGCEVLRSEKELQKELQKEKLKDHKREQYSYLRDRLAEYSNWWGRPLIMDGFLKLVTDFKDTILDMIPRNDIIQYLLESDIPVDKTRD